MSGAPASWQRFAAATDELLAGRLGLTSLEDPIAAELKIARLLAAAGSPESPDPLFVSQLRAALRGRAGRSRRATAAEAPHIGEIDTALGRLLVAYRTGRVLRCSIIDEAAGSAPARFVQEVAALTSSTPTIDAQPPAAIARAVRDHIAGRRRFALADLSSLTPFQRRVLEKTAEIPRGEVRPYGWIAREIGAPGATRAVGTALGHNPIPVLIPCHRVVRTDGTLGEYSGGGPAVKQRILEAEGLPVSQLLAAQARGERLRGSRTTHIVCYPTCHAAARIRPQNAVPFASLAVAERDGYRPCKQCRPA